MAERKRGRPKKAPELRRRNIIKMRMTNSLKASMMAIAEDEGCSLSHAVELCLERYIARRKKKP